MSATRDTSQKHKFVFQNLYHIYKKQDPIATQATMVAIQSDHKPKVSPQAQLLINNLEKLQNLHKELQLMLKELEDLVKE